MQIFCSNETFRKASVTIENVKWLKNDYLCSRKLKSSVMKENESQKIAFSEKFGYSLGDAAANLVFQMMMIFQLKFYTDVFGLDGIRQWVSCLTVPRHAGASSARGSCGQRFLSVCSMCWLSITRVFMTRERWLSMLPSRTSC